jgi:protocatechuate 3,4-dioxygenase beta subunit
VPAHLFSRRDALRGGLAFGAAALFAPGAFAEQLLRTPSLTEGPFYPDKLPLDTDNDLLVVGNDLTPAVGQVTHLTGRVRTLAGSPVRNATVEIWQCDANQVYLHSRDSSGKNAQKDPHFQGFGRFETGSDGAYRFRTIKPVPYPGRPAPHIHVKVRQGDRELLTTQVMVRGHAGNAKDGIFRQAGDLIDQELVQADFVPLKGSTAGELAAVFDIVLGRTPDESRPRKR